MKHIFNTCSKRNRRAYNYILITVLLTIIYQTFHTYFSSFLGVIMSLIILLYGFSALIIYYRNIKLNTWGRFMLFFLVYFLLVGIMHGGTFNNNVIALMLSQDIRYVMFFLLGGVFAFDGNMNYFHKIMRIIGVISIALGIVALFFFNSTDYSIYAREGTWSISYYCWWCSAACFYYWGYYSMFIKKDTAIGYGVMIVYILLGLLFLKRSVVVDSAVMILFYLIFAPKKKGYLKPIWILTLAVLVFTLFRGQLLNTIYDLMLGRFDLSLEDFDRQIEAEAYFSSARKLDLIFGNGIGHYYNSTSIRNTAGTLNALHLGWANIIYKGGIFYAIYCFAMYLVVIINIFKHPKDDYRRVCLGVAISSLVSLFYAGSWTYTILPFCISAPIFYVNTYNANKKFSIPL